MHSSPAGKGDEVGGGIGDPHHSGNPGSYHAQYRRYLYVERFLWTRWASGPLSLPQSLTRDAFIRPFYRGGN